MRRCVAAARDPGAIIACEVAGRQQWQRVLETTRAALERRLNGEALERFRRSQAAWASYREAEVALLQHTLGGRADGLGPPLVEGARTDLVRRRAEQLRAHLASLQASRH